MSVLIKGMAMPRGCDECYIREKDACPLLKVNVGEWGRMLNCPLVELHDHGDLIDRDALKDKSEFIGDAFSGRGGFAVWGDDVVNAPAVIPAERSE